MDLGPDSALCEGEPLTLDATTPSATYLWQDNSVSADFEVSSSGTYWVEVTANGCVSQDTVIVQTLTYDSTSRAGVWEFPSDTIQWRKAKAIDHAKSCSARLCIQ